MYVCMYASSLVRQPSIYRPPPVYHTRTHGHRPQCEGKKQIEIQYRKIQVWIGVQILASIARDDISHTQIDEESHGQHISCTVSAHPRKQPFRRQRQQYVRQQEPALAIPCGIESCHVVYQRFQRARIHSRSSYIMPEGDEHQQDEPIMDKQFQHPRIVMLVRAPPIHVVQTITATKKIKTHRICSSRQYFHQGRISYQNR